MMVQAVFPSLVVPDSLAETLDAVNEALFFSLPLDGQQKAGVSAWLAGRQGQPGSYAGLCAPTGRDFSTGVQVFTGERVTSHAATAHILGEEASRVLALLGVDDPQVRQARDAAAAGFLKRIAGPETLGSPVGTYCCGKCTPAFWRNLAAGGLGPGAEARLSAGVRSLQTLRDGAGRWRRYIFHFTVLALTEIELPEALEELRYAAPQLERLASRHPSEERYARRRHALAERALARI
jgi:hypothetical protein